MLEDAENFGDDRRSPIVERAQAQAIKETDMLPTEPVTVILSEKGWIRSAKGHDIDPTTLSYKTSDNYLSSACGRSNMPALFVDSAGRSYAIAAHTLPSSRGQGEPITGRINPPPGAHVVGVVMGDENQQLLMASDAGYGFVTKLVELNTKNRNGKVLLRPPKGSKALSPILINDIENDLIVSVTNQGRMLVFPVSGLPELTKGKGNKIINIPSAKVIAREEFVVGYAIISIGQALKLVAGKRFIKLSLKDLEHYRGERGRRGNKLPRGYQRIDKLETESK